MTPKGYRKHKFFQLLTDDIGNPHLEKHLASVVALMRVSKTWDGFKRFLAQAFPPSRIKQLEMELGDQGDEEILEDNG